MHNYFLRLSVLLCTFFSFSFAQDVLLSVDGSSLNYVSNADIYGFQFDHDGCATSSNGGDAGANGFTVSGSASTVLGFSFTGGFIPAGEGTLVDLGSSDCTQDALSGFVFSAAPGLPELSSGFAEDNGDDGGNAPDPTVSINSPEDGGEIEGNDIAVSVSCTDCEGYHYHAYLDGNMAGMFFQDNSYLPCFARVQILLYKK